MQFTGVVRSIIDKSFANHVPDVPHRWISFGFGECWLAVGCRHFTWQPTGFFPVT